MSVSVFDHPVLSALLGDDEAADLFSAAADLAAMVRFEVALAAAGAAEGVIASAAASAIAAAAEGFEPNLADLRVGTARDGVPVPELVRQLREAVGPLHGDAVHVGATSQDVIDTSLVLRLRDLAALVDRRLEAVVARLDGLADTFGTRELMGRTRMRRALPIHVGDRIASWRSPLARHRDRLAEATARGCVLQFGGPVGLPNEGRGDAGRAVAVRLGEQLDLPVPETAWHGQRDNLAEFAGVMAMVSGSLGKIGQDIALMAQDEIAEVSLSGGGGSSAMPRKSNPVGAEVLIASARFCATLLPAMHHALVHEQERSGAAWTLEWMVLPQVCVATAAALATADKLLSGVQGMGSAAS